MASQFFQVSHAVDLASVRVAPLPPPEDGLRDSLGRRNRPAQRSIPAQDVVDLSDLRPSPDRSRATVPNPANASARRQLQSPFTTRQSASTHQLGTGSPASPHSSRLLPHQLPGTPTQLQELPTKPAPSRPEGSPLLQRSQSARNMQSCSPMHERQQQPPQQWREGQPGSPTSPTPPCPSSMGFRVFPQREHSEASRASLQRSKPALSAEPVKNRSESDQSTTATASADGESDQSSSNTSVQSITFAVQQQQNLTSEKISQWQEVVMLMREEQARLNHRLELTEKRLEEEMNRLQGGVQESHLKQLEARLEKRFRAMLDEEMVIRRAVESHVEASVISLRSEVLSVVRAELQTSLREALQESSIPAPSAGHSHQKRRCKSPSKQLEVMQPWQEQPERERIEHLDEAMEREVAHRCQLERRLEETSEQLQSVLTFLSSHLAEDKLRENFRTCYSRPRVLSSGDADSEKVCHNALDGQTPPCKVQDQPSWAMTDLSEDTVKDQISNHGGVACAWESKLSAQSTPSQQHTLAGDPAR